MIFQLFWWFCRWCFVHRREIPPSLSVHLVSEMAVGAGLGSSAAFAVCISASLLTHFGVIICDPTCCDNIAGKLVPQADQLALINHWAFLIEKIIHGNASGIDNTVSTYGGIIKYCDREMSRIACNLQLDVAVVDTQMPRDTKMMVELVQRRRKLVRNVSYVRYFSCDFPDFINWKRGKV